MRNAETILGIVRDRGRRRLPLERVYRLLYNPELYLAAYAKIATNAGALTPGVTGETADGRALDKIHRIIGLLRKEQYRFSPARRVYIAKKHSMQQRPLGIPTWSDKLVQEVVRLILEASDEPRCSDRSHGFPRRVSAPGGPRGVRPVHHGEAHRPAPRPAPKVGFASPART